MAGKGGSKANVRPIVIIRREEVVEGGHHGGAWKVAYADFVTAMMAFFLLMWLLNATTEDQRRGLADYFSPTSVLARSSSGFGAPFGGHTPNDTGSLASDRGAVQIMNAQARPVFDVEDDDSDVPAQSAAFHDGGDSSHPTRKLQTEHPGGLAPHPAANPADAASGSAAAAVVAQAEVARQERPTSSRPPHKSGLPWQPTRHWPHSVASLRWTSRRKPCGSKFWTRSTSRCSRPARPC